MLRVCGIVFTLAAPLWPVIAFGQTLAVDGSNSPFVLASPATFSRVTVSGGGTLVANAALSVTGDLTVKAGGRVTIDEGIYSLRLEVGGALTVDLGGTIDVYAKGLPPSTTIDPLSGAIVHYGSPTSGVGGSHRSLGGGVGSAASYDDPANPDLPGGGGTRWDSGGGSHGGGIIRIVAATAQVNGTLNADGETTTISGAPVGAGAGGAINLLVRDFTGGGKLSARGASVSASGRGGGGGGLIRVSYASSSFIGDFAVEGGAGSFAGGPGSVLLLNSVTNTAFIPAGEYPLRTGESFHAISPSPGGTLRLVGATAVATPIAIPVGAAVVVDSEHAFDGLALEPVIEGVLQVNADVSLRDPLLVAGSLIVNRRLSLPALDTLGGALITHSAQVTSMHLVVAGTLHLAPRALVDGVGLGLPADTSLDPATGGVRPGSGAANGGSHGGLGGRDNVSEAVAPTYDDPEGPRWGGGGGGSNPNGGNFRRGGAGGGVLRLTAGLLQVDGSIVADGAGSTGSGAGAGGTIALQAGTLSGSGAVLARGHQVAAATAGGGGGGLIHLAYDTSTFSGTKSVAGGLGATAGAPGVIVEKTITLAPAFISSAYAKAKVAQRFSHLALATGTKPMAWTLVAGPAAATLDSATGALAWLPTATGGVEFTLAVSNAFGSALQTLVVEVTDESASDGGLRAPRFLSSPDTSAHCGVPYRYSGARVPEVAGTGPFAFSVVPVAGVPLPSALKVDSSTGEFDWIPSPRDFGSHPVELRVDGAGGQAKQTFAVAVDCPSLTTPLQVGCGCGSTTGPGLELAGLVALWVTRKRWWLRKALRTCPPSNRQMSVVPGADQRWRSLARPASASPPMC